MEHVTGTALMLRAAVFFSLLAACLTVQAQNTVYKTVDKDGNVVFTDAPPASAGNAEKVDIQRVNTTPAVTKPEVKESAAIQAADPNLAPAEQEVEITTPANNETIPMGPGNFTVGVKVKPRLTLEQSLQLFMDGVPYGDPQRNAFWEMLGVFRGEHTLTVGIMDSKGEISSMSNPITVFVLRPSIR